MNFLSDLILVFIALVGFGFMTSGKPRRRKHIIKDTTGDMYYYKKDNFTKKIIKLLIFLTVLYFLGSMVK